MTSSPCRHQAHSKTSFSWPGRSGSISVSHILDSQFGQCRCSSGFNRRSNSECSKAHLLSILSGPTGSQLHTELNTCRVFAALAYDWCGSHNWVAAKRIAPDVNRSIRCTTNTRAGGGRSVRSTSSAEGVFSPFTGTEASPGGLSITMTAAS